MAGRCGVNSRLYLDSLGMPHAAISRNCCMRKSYITSCVNHMLEELTRDQMGERMLPVLRTNVNTRSIERS
jgi:hypothetical protein